MDTYDEGLDLENMLVDFSAMDRCDRCGAQACSKFERDDAKSELLFCGHHYREVSDHLLIDGWVETLGSNAPELLGFVTSRERAGI